MKDTFESAKELFKERIKNPMYGIFILAWCVCNWRPIYTTLFVNEDKIWGKTGLLKIEFILTFYNFNSFWWFIWSLMKLFFLPALFIFLYYWIFSELDKLVYEKSKNNEKEKMIIKNKQEDELIKQKQKLTKDETELIKNEKEKIEAKKELKQEMTQEEIWDEEYGQLINSKIFHNAMKSFVDCIYEYQGKLNNYSRKILPKEVFSFLDLNNLVKKLDSNTIEPTTKGKYFLKKYLIEIPN